MADSFTEYEEMAAAVLPSAVRDFVAGGSGFETTVQMNRAAFDSVTLTPRVLGGISSVNTIWPYFGGASMPVVVAPMAYQRLLHSEGSCCWQEQPPTPASPTRSAR